LIKYPLEIIFRRRKVDKVKLEGARLAKGTLKQTAVNNELVS
jgi:hypothetical protein